ncbi:heterokaryon incompatibility protein-domain-containing protein [Bisporella sp. PMI_857]|nr:heterokaryon incompatibility protein-domain-containing protein [Bisporella sp. PMI_857]
MHLYEYSRLDLESKEIRLVTLLPGAFNDPIRVTISHEPFDVPNVRRIFRVFTADEKASLPPGWSVHENYEGEIIYLYEDPYNNTDCASWTHPVPHVTINKSGVSILSPMATKPIYEAVSYVWGSVELLESIRVENGKSLGESSESLDISKNLACALRHLRYVREPRKLWIDAICINQKDFEERALEVKRMDRIFQYAERVVVWLGPQTEKTQLAFSTLEYLGLQIELTCDGYLTPAPDATESLWYGPKYKIPYDLQTWDSILEIYQNPWFQRMWILQEIHLANQNSIVLCGTYKLSWGHLRRALKSIAMKELGMPVNFHEVHKYRRKLIGYTLGNGLEQNLPTLLSLSRFSKCTEPVDRIYGILGLAPQGIRNKIRPNYYLTPGEVYKDLFLKHVALTKRLELFGFCKQCSDSENTPTWVPKFKETYTEPHGFRSYASGFSPAHAQLLSPRMLEVQGVQLARVSAIGKTIIKSDLDIFDLIRDVGLERLQNDLYVTKEPLIKAYTSLIFERAADSQYGNVQRYKKRMAELTEIVLKNAELPYSWQGKPTKPWYSDSLKNAPPRYFVSVVVNHRYIQAREGYIGFAPSEAQIGDIICVFMGCTAPIVLRPAAVSSYEVVGESYVQGLMSGEALLGPLPEPWIATGTDYWVGMRKPRFFNLDDGTTIDEDPRLGDLPTEWKPNNRQQTADDPMLFSPHKNKITGEEINWDPRFSPEALKARGVKLETFKLI